MLHDPSDLATSRFYGGRPDALWDGANVELTNRLTLQRRPGLTPFSTFLYPSYVNRCYSFQLLDGTIRVLADTGPTATYNLSEVEEISGVAYYLFSTPQPCAANNVLVGLIFKVAGFDKGQNNGAFVCVASTSSYLILSNSEAVTDVAFATAVSSGGLYWDQQNGSATLLFGKSPGAGQVHAVGVAGVLYIGDGVDTRKYTPLNPNGTIWNWGIATPTTPPAVTVTASGSAAVLWTASTFYSTMGLLVDSNGNIEWLTSVNSTGANTTQYGSTGNGQPNWNNITGQITLPLDGTITWTCEGPLSLWSSETLYSANACVFVPGVGGTPVPAAAGNGVRGLTYTGKTGGGIFCALSGGKSGRAEPNWNPTTDQGTADAFGHWNFLGAAVAWTPSTRFNSFWEWSNELVCEPTLPNAALLSAGTQKIYVQTANNAVTGNINTPGISGTGYTPPWATTVGQTTQDGDLVWSMLGSKTWVANTLYFAWSQGTSSFSAIVDGNNNFQVCVIGGFSGDNVPLNGWQASTSFSSGSIIAVQSSVGFVQFTSSGGTSGASEPTTWHFSSGATTTDGGITWTSQGLVPAGTVVWGQTYGAQTQDGPVVWVNCGSAKYSTWVPSTKWYLPLNGFAPPMTSQPYGGAEIIGSGDIQGVILSGLSGTLQPTWGAIGSNTNDNQAVWYAIGTDFVNSLSWTKGYVYAYSYESRLVTDPYNIASPPGVASPLGTPTGAETGAISTASPVYTIVGPNSGAVNFVSGLGSTDPAVDTIIIWRSADGGGSSNMFFLTEIPNPTPVNGQAQPWSFADYLPDLPTSVFPGLNNLIPAPIADENDPPPSSFLPMVYNFQRIWGADGANVLFSGGPDVITGNPNEAFNPSDSFPYLAPVTRIVKNSQGLVVLLTDSVEFLGGGPLTSSFYSVTLAPGIGMLSFNALDVYAGEIYFLSSDSQFKTISPSLQLSTTGFAIGDKIAQFNPRYSQVAVQQAGVDNAIFLANGSTGWWRVNPRQVPGGANGPEPIWSPFATIVGGVGCGMVQSVEVAPGVKKLLVGTTNVKGCGYQILERNLNVWTDNGVEYDAWFTMGSITLAHPGQLALLKFIEGDFSGFKYQPQISVLLDEIAGTFTNMVNPVFDPPSLYGVTLTPTSYSPLRFYFASTGALARARHLQIRVDFGMTSNGDELYDLTIFGRLTVEG